MMRIQKTLLFFILTINIVFTQHPIASFSDDEYSIDENLDRYSVTLQIDNPKQEDLGGILIYLYADPSVIQFDDESVSWDLDTPFQHENLSTNVDNDTLKIAAYSTQLSGNFTVSFAEIFNISFNIIGEEADETSLEFITFQLGGTNPNYTKYTIPSNIILVSGTLGCTDNGECTEDTCGYVSPHPGVSACNYASDALNDDGTCEYKSCAGCDEVPNSGLENDECGNCDGDGYALVCVGNDDCDNMDCSGECGGSAKNDECNVCGGGNYVSVCVGNDDCSDMDCAGVCNGVDLLTPCGDCSDNSSCNFSISVATMDNNYKSDNIQIPISLNDFNYAEFSELSSQTQGFEGMEFTIKFDAELLEFNPDNYSVLFEGLNYGFDVDVEQGEITGTLTDDSNVELYQSLNGEIIILSFDVIDSRYKPELHGNETAIDFSLSSINAVDLSTNATGILTLLTRACIDPFSSTIDSNFICDMDEDVCDDNGILEESNIFNYGCILPDPDFENILANRMGNEEVISESDDYTLKILEGSEVSFPSTETSLDIISSNSVDIEFLPDVAPGAQLAGPLVGLYPFGTTFEPPVEFRFKFEDLSRGISEYKILYMDDIQTGDWEELGTCSGEPLLFCKIEELSSSGLFIVMYGENLEIDESIISMDFNLYQSYPNPFNPTTTLEFDVANSGIVNFTVYNINGQIVESISPKFYTPGNYQIKWEAHDVPSGIYLIQMKTESSVHLQKVMFLK